VVKYLKININGHICTSYGYFTKVYTRSAQHVHTVYIYVD